MFRSEMRHARLFPGSFPAFSKENNISCLAAIIWRALSTDEKAPWHRLADQEKRSLGFAVPSNTTANTGGYEEPKSEPEMWIIEVAELLLKGHQGEDLTRRTSALMKRHGIGDAIARPKACRGASASALTRPHRSAPYTPPRIQRELLSPEPTSLDLPITPKSSPCSTAAPSLSNTPTTVSPKHIFTLSFSGLEDLIHFADKPRQFTLRAERHTVPAVAPAAPALQSAGRARGRVPWYHTGGAVALTRGLPLRPSFHRPRPLATLPPSGSGHGHGHHRFLRLQPHPRRISTHETHRLTPRICSIRRTPVPFSTAHHEARRRNPLHQPTFDHRHPRLSLGLPRPQLRRLLRPCLVLSHASASVFHHLLKLKPKPKLKLKFCLRVRP
jgi:hypothetical protein